MPNDVLSVLGARLKAARKERDLTQERLAELSGRSARHIAKIEKGEVNPSFDCFSGIPLPRCPSWRFYRSACHSRSHV